MYIIYIDDGTGRQTHTDAHRQTDTWRYEKSLNRHILLHRHKQPKRDIQRYILDRNEHKHAAAR